VDPDSDFEMPAWMIEKYLRLTEYLKNGIRKIVRNDAVMNTLMQ